MFRSEYADVPAVELFARVTGHARAGHLSLLAACDIAAASDRAAFASTEVLAPVPDGLRRASPEALTETERLLTAKVLPGFDPDASRLTGLSAQLFASPQAREGTTAFLDRRDPAWVV